MPPRHHALGALAALLCGSSLAQAQAKQPATGGIKGTVIFEGTPPERATLRRDTDPYCARTPRDAEDVIVTKGKLKDVLVRIQNGSRGKHAAPNRPAPSGPAVIDQRDCMYTPRVLGVVVGQKLAVRNSDGTFHNVRGKVQPDKALWNKPHPAGDPELKLDTPAKPNDVVEVACDAHPWMRAYAVVQDHPFFAVSREDGTFEITGLAPGKYTLEAWHPTLGMKKMDIKIGTGAKATVPVRFSYKAP